ncbi:MAG: hypothetical protein AB1420_15830 [Bacillota bacterium]
MEKIRKIIEEHMLGATSIHHIVEVQGSPGIVVDEGLAKATPCKCYPIPTPEKPEQMLCFSRGIIGGLTDAQEKLYCPSKVIVEEGISKRVAKFREAVKVCKAEIEKYPKGERLTPWLECMGREAKKRSIEL